MHDRLTLLPKTNWDHLERVRDYLRDQGVGDGELSCMHMPTIWLYGDLGVRPATRFNFVYNFVVSLPRRRDVILGELAREPSAVHGLRHRGGRDGGVGIGPGKRLPGP